MDDTVRQALAELNDVVLLDLSLDVQATVDAINEDLK